MGPHEGGSPQRGLGDDAQELTAAALSVLRTDLDALVREEVRKVTPSAVRGNLVRIAAGLFVGAVLVVASALVLFFVLFHGVKENADQIKTTSRQSSYRGCVRDSEARAEQLKPVPKFILRQFKLPKGYLTEQNAGLQARIPITDCTPILAGHDPIPLDSEQTRAYVSVYARTGRPPETRDGRVTGRVLTAVGAIPHR